MKIIRNLTVTTEEFYSHLENQLLKIANEKLEDQEAYTSADLQDGFRILQGEGAAQIELLIEHYVPGEIYKVSAHSMTDSYVMSYQTRENNGKLEVIYEQENLTDASDKKKGFFSKLGEALYLSRMSNGLYDIQNEILKKRPKLTQ